MVATLRQEMRSLASPQKAKAAQWFFKTGKGEYGEGDVFIGLTVPQQRQIAKKYRDLPLSDIKELLLSKIHEERLIAVFILVDQFKRGDAIQQKIIHEFYLKNRQGVNNWDILDSSTPYIISMYLLDKPRDILYTLVKSKNLWDRRMAIMGTFAFIRFKKESADTFKIVELLLTDTHDLIHKACGWMLREVGKNISHDVEEKFLQKYYQTMPRTMLRYAIEHFPETKRQFYLGKMKKNSR